MTIQETELQQMRQCFSHNLLHIHIHIICHYLYTAIKERTDMSATKSNVNEQSSNNFANVAKVSGHKLTYFFILSFFGFPLVFLVQL